MVSRTIKMLEAGESSWIKLERKDQYELLGFHHDTSKLLYVENYSNLKCCPDQWSLPDFLWQDINLSKQSGFPKSTFTLGEDQPNQPTFVMFRSRCNGVKVGYRRLLLERPALTFKTMITGVWRGKRQSVHSCSVKQKAWKQMPWTPRCNIKANRWLCWIFRLCETGGRRI